MSEKQFYTVPFVWSRTLWVMTFAFFALWLGVSGYMLYQTAMAESMAEPIVSFVIFNVIMLLTALICEGYAPQRLEIGADRVTILRRYNSVTIYRDKVQSIERLPSSARRRAVRVGGVGGLFGYYGNYYSRSIGRFKLYATNSQNLYLIRMRSGESVVISCDEPELLERIFKLA